MRKFSKHISKNYMMKQLNKYILIILTLSSFIFNQKVESRISDTESSESEKIYKRAKKLERKGFFDESEKLLIEIFLSDGTKYQNYCSILKCLRTKEKTSSHLIS